MEQAVERSFQPERDRFSRQWVIFLVLLAIGIGIWKQMTHIPERSAPAPAGTEADWFLMLRMPAVTAQYESGIDTMRGRYAEWLDSLAHAGFKPMHLSEVYRRLHAGQKIPARTVVMVFDPGYRRTYQVVAPILAEHNWPAVWMSPVKEMNEGHREYVTYHHEDRIHDALDKDTPYRRAMEPRPSAAQEVISMPRLGGLHHRYAWRKAA